MSGHGRAGTCVRGSSIHKQESRQRRRRPRAAVDVEILPALVGLPCAARPAAAPDASVVAARAAAAAAVVGVGDDGAVVARAGVGVGERGVGMVKPDKLFVPASSGRVGVALPRQAPVRRLDLPPRRARPQPQHLVQRAPPCRRRRRHRRRDGHRAPDRPGGGGDPSEPG